MTAGSHALTYLNHLVHAKELGIELVACEPDRGFCAMRLPWRPELVGDPEREILHGGVITTLLDTLGGAAVFARNLPAQATLDLRIDYLRPALARADLIGEAECHRHTRHVAFVRGLCHQGDAAHPVALMTCTYVLADRISAVGGIEP